MKIIVMVVVAMLSLAVFACSSPSVTLTPTEPPDASPTPTPQPVAWAADGIVSLGEYPDSQAYGNWEIRWRTDDKYAYIAIKARTGGWVAIGVKPEGRMKNADMVLGFVKDGEAFVTDMFSTGDFGPHPPDVDQGGTDSILEHGGSEEGGFTTIEFKRALDTGDSRDKPLTTGKNQILWAFGSADNSTFQHSSRGYGEIEIR